VTYLLQPMTQKVSSSAKQLKVTITVFSLASDDDSGTRAEVFATEREAVNALLDQLRCSEQEREGMIAAYFAQTDDFYEKLDQWKSDLDTYSIDQHTLEIEINPSNIHELV